VHLHVLLIAMLLQLKGRATHIAYSAGCNACKPLQVLSTLIELGVLRTAKQGSSRLFVLHVMQLLPWQCNELYLRSVHTVALDHCYRLYLGIRCCLFVLVGHDGCAQQWRCCLVDSLRHLIITANNLMAT
jgi:hypothetical protein